MTQAPAQERVCPECGVLPGHARRAPLPWVLHRLPAILMLAILLYFVLQTLAVVRPAPGVLRYQPIQTYSGPISPSPAFVCGGVRLGELRSAAQEMTPPPDLARSLATLRLQWSDLEPQRDIEVGFAPPSGTRICYEVLGWPAIRRETYLRRSFDDVIAGTGPGSPEDWSTWPEHSVTRSFGQCYEVWLHKVGGADIGQRYVRDRRFDLPVVVLAAGLLGAMVAWRSLRPARRRVRISGALATAALIAAALLAYGWNNSEASDRRYPPPRPGAMSSLNMTQREAREAIGRPRADLNLARRILAMAPPDTPDDWTLLAQYQDGGTWAFRMLEIGGETAAATLTWDTRHSADGSALPRSAIPWRVDFDRSNGVFITLPRAAGAGTAAGVSLHLVGTARWVLWFAAAWGAGAAARGIAARALTTRRRRASRCVHCGYPLA